MPPTPTPNSSTPPLSDLPTAFSPSTCIRRGLCPVTSLRAQGPEILESHSLYYEVHGKGGAAARENVQEGGRERTKVVFVMGLNSSSFSWGPQVRWFGGERSAEGSSGGAGTEEGEEEEEYEALVFDNRGVGNSGYPRGPYTTSGMAEDVICLLDYLGWKEDRQLNIVGLSLGGMIAQELAYRIPQRISSLMLAVTTPGGYLWNNFPPVMRMRVVTHTRTRTCRYPHPQPVRWKGLSCLTKLTFTPDPVEKVPTVMDMLFPLAWLEQKVEGDPRGRTNRQVQSEAFLHRVAITKPQRLPGNISQMAAALTHHLPPSRLARIAELIPKIIILTGDDDHLVRPSGSRRIYAAMCRGTVWQGGAGGRYVPIGEAEEEGEGEGEGKGRKVELVEWEGTGHGIHVQKAVEFNRLVERCVREGRRRVREERERECQACLQRGQSHNHA
ncbi:Alpha/Beta hydrolase protein [Crassisporium funariophilum]|nr:Alpha/Beta hydrolase protein [Crassisporium funariophilum]